MKLSRSLALAALLIVITAVSINCIQGSQPPQPSSSPAPTTEPLPANALTRDQQYNIYNIAVNEPYIRKMIPRLPGRTVIQAGDNWSYTNNYTLFMVTYMSCREIGPDFDRTKILPAAIILTGDNFSKAGVNVVAFVNTSANRVEYVGYVPRPGYPLDNLQFTSVDGGVQGTMPNGDVYYNLRNVTIVDTGYTSGMSLSPAEIDRATALAMTNATVQGYIDGHSASMRSTEVYSYETGWPYRYILTYPMVTIDVADGMTTYDTVYVLVDLRNNRVVGVTHGEPPIT